MYIILTYKSNSASIERSLFISGLNYNKYKINFSKYGKLCLYNFVFVNAFEIITNNENDIIKINKIINKYKTININYKNVHDVHSIIKKLKEKININDDNSVTNIIIQNLIFAEYNKRIYKTIEDNDIDDIMENILSDVYKFNL